LAVLSVNKWLLLVRAIMFSGDYKLVYY